MENQFVLITGGAGFIGSNIARSYLERQQPVHILDNLARSGVERNLAELVSCFPGRVLFTEGDVRDRRTVEEAVETASAVYHLAAQVAVTTSLESPVADMETNLIGTLNVLESIRASAAPRPLIFTSTNKVYGKLAHVPLCEHASRYQPQDSRLAEYGVAEDQPLEFLSPYGCSKGSADQYVLDYARSYGIPATVFRMSCIYGPYQLGTEDQGWVAHFIRQALKREPITIYGDGKQVRDLLFVEDLVEAMRLALDRIDVASGVAFNMGGGAANSASLLEIVSEIESLAGDAIRIERGPERLGDQRWYVADTSKARELLGWNQTTYIRRGLRRLFDWCAERTEAPTQTEIQEAQCVSL
jgi:CDP-paratose 2-epimerase